jgi:3',5'-cyclic AMP phosphodiesterase CpdA
VRAGFVAVAIAVVALSSCSDDGPPPEASREPIRQAPLPKNGVRFVVIGDFGTGGEPQRTVASSMCELHDRARFDVVVTTGDNVYPSGSPDDFQEHFKDPYLCLAERGVRWRAVFGNHDVETAGGVFQIQDPAFGMPGRYYAWRLGPVRFTMLDSNNLDPAQLDWMRARLEDARAAPWSVVVFHHPVFSGGAKYGNTDGFDDLLGNTFARTGVDLVLNGHEHVYSRGEDGDVAYVVSGGGGAGVYPCAADFPPEVSVCEPVHHFLAIEATPRSLIASPITSEGALERVRIAPNP